MRRRVDYGSLILLLVILIVGIFGVDYLRRKFADWKNTQNPLVVNTVMNESNEPRESQSGDGESVTTEKPKETVLTAATTIAWQTTVVTSANATPPGGYKTVSVANEDLHKGSLVLVDSSHAAEGNVESKSFMDFTYDHLRLPSKNLTIAAETTDSLVNMFNAFFNATKLGNVMIYSTMNAPTAAQYSVVIPERVTGLTIDMAVLNEANGSHTPFTGDGNYAWFLEHAHEYGYVQRFPAGKDEKTGQSELKWHYRYVGVPHAQYMHEHSLCLEEYLEELKSKYPYSGNHLKVTVGETDYEIYYVPVSTGATSVSVPKDKFSEISGDNVGGFIVTAYHVDGMETEESAETTAPAETTTTT